ncbi:hypothetical protein [Bacillus paralicheniformis]|uniref:hypothetical protein n=1 Tax=Bacillus paralicheniformis TaxID=1648923 RepID=UPI002DC042C2|nr:hypothetical protein [Bacillus paralicheniformis]MEC1052527.1 hypothetical protein [Bacillus paralicheniformis]MEC1139375.1 hypothetical protein [Bacillus paralicheniformis]MEC1236299.1 hypothetical protein [Bacillus paralicheniformis]MEC1283999.1 hypothetical protein [Bacillus paralicheniformis]MEC1293365.1 hypothetical protein [Bacillus paralicheniformis]
MCEYIELQRNEREYMLLKVSELQKYCRDTLGISYEGFLQGYTFDDVEFIENYLPELNHSQSCPNCNGGRFYRQAIEEVKIHICDTCPAMEIEFHRDCNKEEAIETARDFFINFFLKH